jgi:hypothetical protein
MTKWGGGEEEQPLWLPNFISKKNLGNKKAQPLHIPEKETEVQKGHRTCSRSHSENGNKTQCRIPVWTQGRGRQPAAKPKGAELWVEES